MIRLPQIHDNQHYMITICCPPLILENDQLNEDFLAEIQQTLNPQRGKLTDVGQNFIRIKPAEILNDNLVIGDCPNGEFRRVTGLNKHKTCVSLFRSFATVKMQA